MRWYLIDGNPQLEIYSTNEGDDVRVHDLVALTASGAFTRDLVIALAPHMQRATPPDIYERAREIAAHAMRAMHDEGHVVEVPPIRAEKTVYADAPPGPQGAPVFPPAPPAAPEPSRHPKPASTSTDPDNPAIWDGANSDAPASVQAAMHRNRMREG